MFTYFLDCWLNRVIPIFFAYWKPGYGLRKNAEEDWSRFCRVKRMFEARVSVSAYVVGRMLFWSNTGSGHTRLAKKLRKRGKPSQKPPLFNVPGMRDFASNERSFAVTPSPQRTLSPSASRREATAAAPRRKAEIYFRDGFQREVGFLELFKGHPWPCRQQMSVSGKGMF